MEYTQHRKAVELLYEDMATIRRNVEVVKPNKATGTQLQEIYADQPCRLSKKSLGQNNQSEAQNDIGYQVELFISPELVIMQGDEIEVVGRGRSQVFTAGEPFVYSSHQEVSLQREGYA